MKTNSTEENVMSAPFEYGQRISWRAIFAGVLIAIVVQIMLSLLGLGIGLSTIDAASESDPTKGLGTGTLIWYGLSSIVSVFAGAWVAGRMAKFTKSVDSVIHGLLTWSLVVVLTIYLLSSAIGNIIGGAGRLLGGITRVAGQGISAAAPGVEKGLKGVMKDEGVDLADLKSEASRLLDKNSGGNGNLTDQIIDQVFNKKEGVKPNREDAIGAIMRQTGKSRAEAEGIADTLETKYEQAKVKFDEIKKEAEVKARQAADDAAAGASKAAFSTFIGLLLGALAAGFGSKIGRDSRLRHD